MSATLVLPQRIGEQLAGAARLRLENGGTLLVSVVDAGGGTLRLLGREFIPVPDAAYLRRDENALTVTSDGYVAALARAEAIGAAALWVHTHPGVGSSPLPSSHDHEVDHRLADPFRVRTGRDVYGALIVSPTETSIAFSGHLNGASGGGTAITRLWAVGDRLALTHSVDATTGTVDSEFDRNVRALGPAGQLTLGALCIAIVGCGGTGSAVAEQLARLGVRNFVLVDPDVLSASNVTRVYGSSPVDVGRSKVAVLSNHLRRIAPLAKVQAIEGMTTQQSIARNLARADLVFGCTDDNAGRLVLSRLSTYLLVPVIDCGVLISSDAEGVISGINGRVTVLRPGSACLVCRDRIDLDRARAELLNPAERRRLADEGYAPALGAAEPAVVTFTTLVAATAVDELLERLVGYGPDPRPTEILIRCHEREVSTNVAVPRAGHYCADVSGQQGAGADDPFLGLAWAA